MTDSNNGTVDGLALADMTPNQVRFVQDAQREGLEVESYSGRGMCGESCPSVRVNRICDATFTRAEFDAETLGLGLVLYARS